MVFRNNIQNYSLHSKLYIRAENAEKINIEKIKRLIIHEYNKYPDIIEKSKLEIVNLVSKLQVKNNKDIDKFFPVSQSPDPEANMMYVDVDYISDEEYFKQCINHEIWHLYDFATSGTCAPRDLEWEKLNPKGFEYGEGGWVGYHTDFQNKFHPISGFITSYATLGIAEDKAETFMYYFTDQLRPKLEAVMKKDKCLRRKVELILEKSGSKLEH
jgi:hypothetical protein